MSPNSGAPAPPLIFPVTMFRVAPEGRIYIFVLLAAAAVPAVLGYTLPSAVLLVLALFMVYFFRDPDRFTLAGRGLFYAPADGKVVLIRETEEDELLKSQAIEISIFMSPLNVHVNRVPCDGIVKEVKHYPGKFLPAFKNDAAPQNEHISMLYDTKFGNIVLKQVAGFMARRAVCRAVPGDSLQQGDRYGIIKFSSRVDLFLPLDTVVKVQLNEKVKAGETVLGIIGD